MARARNIKPSFFINEHLVELDPIYRLLFIGLWTLADREGRIENRPKKIKMELFPADDISIQQGLLDLCKTGFIQLYNCYGTDVIQIINFAKHQKPHGLEKDSDLPNSDGMFTIYPRNEKNKTVNGDGVLHNYESYCSAKGIDINQSFEENHDNNCFETVIERTINALNPECGILNPECGMINVETSVSTSDKPKRFDFKKALLGVGGNEDLITAFMAIRKTKKATNSEPAFKLFMSNVQKSGMGLNQILEICIQRDWKGFDPSWLKNQNNNRGTDNFHDQFYGVGQSPFGQQQNNQMRDVGNVLEIPYEEKRF